MNPDVVDAVERLRAEGVIGPDPAARFLRAARRELVSVRFELRTLLYAGILLVTGGVGLFLQKYVDRLGPWGVGLLVGAASGACFWYVARRAPPFSWAEVAPPSLAFDYVLLLGILLFASDLAFLQARAGLLGSRWAYHFLAVALVAGASAYRWDSRGALAVALTSFAAWRGVSARVPLPPFRFSTAEVRANAIGVGLLFLLGAVVAVRLGKKAHFEGVWTNLGLVVLFGGLLSGVFELWRGAFWPWVLAVLVVAGIVLFVSFRRRRTLAFGQAVVAAYLAFLRLLFFVAGAGVVTFLLTALSALGVLAILVAAHRRMKEDA